MRREGGISTWGGGGIEIEVMAWGYPVTGSELTGITKKDVPSIYPRKLIMPSEAKNNKNPILLVLYSMCNDVRKKSVYRGAKHTIKGAQKKKKKKVFSRTSKKKQTIERVAKKQITKNTKNEKRVTRHDEIHTQKKRKK